MRSARHAVVAAMVAGIACSSDRGAVDAPSSTSTVATVTQALTNVTTNRGDNGRTGVYDDDLLRPNVLSDFGMNDHKAEVDGRTYAQPLVVGGLDLGRGLESIVFVATTTNNVYAFALKDLHLFWKKGPEVFGVPEDFHKSPLPRAVPGSLINELGILSTPAIDLNQSEGPVMYLVAETGKDLPCSLCDPTLPSCTTPCTVVPPCTPSTPSCSSPDHHLTLWAIDLVSGAPVAHTELSGTMHGVSVDPNFELQRPGLLFMPGDEAVFVALGSVADKRPYNGWVLSYHVGLHVRKTGFTLLDAFTPDPGSGGAPDSDNPDDQGGGGIWQSGTGLLGVNDPSDPSGLGSLIYFLAGNGFVGPGFAVDGRLFNFIGQSAVRLAETKGVFDRPSGEISSSAFTDPEFKFDNEEDLDLGSAGPTLLPGYHALAVGGKTGKIHIIDADTMKQKVEFQATFESYLSTCTPSVPGIPCHTKPLGGCSSGCDAGPAHPSDEPYDKASAEFIAELDSCFTNESLGHDNTPNDKRNCWPHIHGAPIFWAEKELFFVWGERDYLRSYQLHGALSPAGGFDVTWEPTVHTGTVLVEPDGQGGGILALSRYSIPSGHGALVWAAYTLPGGAGRLSAFEATGLGVPVFDFDMLHVAHLQPPVIFDHSVIFSEWPAGDDLERSWLHVLRPNNMQDTDGDGIFDFQDDCPTAANKLQHDTNTDAELATDFLVGDGHRPTTTDSIGYSKIWQLLYPGDACDTNATSLLDTEDIETGNESTGCTLLDPTTPTGKVDCPTCIRKETLSTGLDFVGWIGNTDGKAAATRGRSVPIFCKCLPPDLTSAGEGNPDRCQLAPSNCLVASPAFTEDDLLPKPYGTEKIVSGWKTMTEHGSSKGVPTIGPFSLFGTRHIDLVDKAGIDPFSFSTGPLTWDYRDDLARFLRPPGSDLPGLAWTHVFSILALGDETEPDPNKPNSYRAMVASTGFLCSQTFADLPTHPEWLDPRINADFLGSFDPGTAPPPGTKSRWKHFTLIHTPDGPAVVEQGFGVSTFGNRHLGPGAATMLAPVADGNAHLLIGDDLAELNAIDLEGGVLSALVVDETHRAIFGGLVKAHDDTLCGAPSIPINQPPLKIDPVFSFDSGHGALRVLTPATGSGSFALLETYDVHLLSSLTPILAPPVHHEMLVFGPQPVGPLAMAWSKTAQRLFVLDQTSDAVRLLSMTSRGETQEIWTTKPKPFPRKGITSIANARLTIGAAGEIVLTLDLVQKKGRHFAEVIVFDAAGTPKSSFTLGCPGAVAATYVGEVSFLSGKRRKKPAVDGSDLIPVITPRSAASSGLCGTQWAKHAAGMAAECDELDHDDGDVEDCDDGEVDENDDGHHGHSGAEDPPER